MIRQAPRCGSLFFFSRLPEPRMDIFFNQEWVMREYPKSERSVTLRKLNTHVLPLTGTKSADLNPIPFFVHLFLRQCAVTEDLIVCLIFEESVC